MFSTAVLLRSFCPFLRFLVLAIPLRFYVHYNLFLWLHLRPCSNAVLFVCLLLTAFHFLFFIGFGYLFFPFSSDEAFFFELVQVLVPMMLVVVHFPASSVPSLFHFSGFTGLGHLSLLVLWQWAYQHSAANHFLFFLVGELTSIRSSTDPQSCTSDTRVFSRRFSFFA